MKNFLLESSGKIVFGSGCVREYLAGFAREQKVLLRQLKEANPWLRDYTLHNRSRKLYRIAVPDSASIYYNPQSTPVHDTAWVID